MRPTPDSSTPSETERRARQRPQVIWKLVRHCRTGACLSLGLCGRLNTGTAAALTLKPHTGCLPRSSRCCPFAGAQGVSSSAASMKPWMATGLLAGRLTWQTPQSSLTASTERPAGRGHKARVSEADKPSCWRAEPTRLAHRHHSKRPRIQRETRRGGKACGTK